MGESPSSHPWMLPWVPQPPAVTHNSIKISDLLISILSPILLTLILRQMPLAVKNWIYVLGFLVSVRETMEN